MILSHFMKKLRLVSIGKSNPLYDPTQDDHEKTILSNLIILALFLKACEKDNPYEDFTQERLSTLAGERHEAILRLAQPTACTDPTEWRITDIETVCGRSHIAYHAQVDEGKLTELIRDYNQLIEIYRPMVAPFIYCLGYREPKGVVCEDGKARVVYEE